MSSRFHIVEVIFKDYSPSYGNCEDTDQGYMKVIILTILVMIKQEILEIFHKSTLVLPIIIIVIKPYSCSDCGTRL